MNLNKNFESVQVFTTDINQKIKINFLEIEKKIYHKLPLKKMYIFNKKYYLKI